LAGQFTSGPSSSRPAVGPPPVIQRLDAACHIDRRGDNSQRVGDENKIHIQLLVASLAVADTARGVGGLVCRPEAALSVDPVRTGAALSRGVTAPSSAADNAGAGADRAPVYDVISISWYRQQQQQHSD